MPNVTVTVEATIKMKATETVPCKEYDQLKAKGNLKSNKRLKKELIEVIKDEIGADEVEVVEINTDVHDERVGSNA